MIAVAVRKAQRLTSQPPTLHMVRMKIPPEMVLFDCDGVLVDSEPLTARVLVDNLARHGLSLTHDQLSDMFLGGTMMGMEEQARALGADLPKTWLEDTYDEVFAALAARAPLALSSITIQPRVIM